MEGKFSLMRSRNCREMYRVTLITISSTLEYWVLRMSLMIFSSSASSKTSVISHFSFFWLQ